MTNRASGTFEVKMSPQEAGMSVGRMTIDKQFQGDLAGASEGQMLMAGSESFKNSAGYVAIEKVTGTLNGRSGSFYLQHTGVKMNIIIAEGQHSYEFDYTLAES